MFGERAPDAHGDVFVLQPEFVPAVALKRLIPDKPLVRLLGVFVGATLIMLWM